MNKNFLMILFSVLIFCFAAPAALAAKYSAAISDLPLMQDMREDSNAVVFFDTPQGRIVETSATTRAGHKAIYNFYVSALPPLGWQKRSTGHNIFDRAGETMIIEITTNAATGVNTVRFRITPAEPAR